jgi:hypothetical protein
MSVAHQIGGVAVVAEGSCEGLTSPTTLADPEVALRLITTPVDALPRSVPSLTTDVGLWAASVDGETARLVIKTAHHDLVWIDLERDGLRGSITYRRDYAPHVFYYPIDQLLMIHALTVAGGALIHGAALVGADGGGYLLIGPSGAGKTTLSREAHALGGRILSDERTIVRPRRDGWVLGGTPWPGEGGFADNSVAPLRGIMFLEQAERDELLPLSQARALALVYRCHFPPLWDARASERALDHLERLVSSIPIFRLRNRRGPEAARALLDRLGGPARPAEPARAAQ